MLVIDHSPNNQNITGKPDRIAIYANRTQQYKTAVNYFRKYYKAAFPNSMDISLAQARELLPKNSKIILSCCWNSITGKYELTVTNKTIINHSRNYWKYDFIGNLTDLANMTA